MKPQAQVEYRPIKDLKELPGNPRTIKKDQFEKLKQSIKDNADYFEARPIILSDRTGELVILAGNQRYKAAKAKQKRRTSDNEAGPSDRKAYRQQLKRERERVLDIFGGSGTTMIAAEQLNRICYMMELDPHYADVIIERWEKFTGEKAELIKAANDD